MTYELESENLTGLGGPMGTEKTWSNWRKFFTSIAKAKKYAEEDYRKQSKKKENEVVDMGWVKERNRIRSQDLLFVMYNITEIKVEK